MKRFTTSRIRSEMTIKTTMGPHLTLLRVAAIKEQRPRGWRGCGETGTLIPCEKCMVAPQKTEDIMTTRSRCSFLGAYSKEGRAGSLRDLCSQQHDSLQKTWTPPKRLAATDWCPVTENAYMSTMEYYAASERKEVLPSATTWINLKDALQVKSAIHKRANWFRLHKIL